MVKVFSKKGVSWKDILDRRTPVGKDITAVEANIVQLMVPLQLRVGDQITIHDWLTEKNIIRVGKDAKLLSHSSLVKVFYTLSRSIPFVMHNIYEFISNKVELDSGFVEVKTKKFKDVTIDQLCKELHATETFVERLAKNIDPSARIEPYSASDFEDTYAGSFHFWFTLPHPLNMDFSNVDSFLANHASFADCLQHIEPLLLTCTGGDPRAIGNGTNYPRANMRGQDEQNILSGIVETRDAIDGLKGHVHEGPCDMKISYDGTKLYPYCNVKGADRYNYENYNYNNYNNNYNNIEGDTLNLSIRAKDANASFEMSRGNDIRFVPNGPMVLKVEKGWRPVVIKRGSIFQICFTKDGVLENKVPQRSKPSKFMSPVGFEFRLMDNMPSVPTIKPLLHVFALVAAASQKHNKCSPPKSLALKSAAASILIEGRFAKVPSSYVKDLSTRLGVKIGDARKLDARGVLDSCIASLFEQYKDSQIVQTLLGSTMLEKPVLPDNNLDAWWHAFSRKLESSSPEDQEKIKMANSSLSEKTALDILGKDWRYDIPFLLQRHL
ncbi:hypothetical protein CEUSTIGMA_g12562.t1 [Chlamydomonas eustigma]|uniref:Uncharacterized protein n=1 Tax=Chlamydomonas eustigma TaxID=1157962 RepID=A0A250XQ53_9CHLO|nr:hypothetical protein CEUSTIGMA_g12562.t1 [Chlamydomonas eustigma]|eukprot:GAX85143.1 hypothetical protein CEUSTIGMA_g12562.t1 [Chlamydomonas eustigma]